MKVQEKPTKIMQNLALAFFDAYNESDILIGGIARYCEQIGHYLERVFADKISRNWDNLAYCKLHGIRLSGLRLDGQRKIL